MYYLLWHDDAKKTPIADKIAAAIEAFSTRFKVRPTLVLVNATEVTAIPDIRVEIGASVLPGDFWLGPVEGVWL
jgi:predicted component of type VI protein secretion system